MRFNAKFGQRIQNHFSGKGRETFEKFEKRSLYIRVCYKEVSKSIESLNRIFWDVEYWFKFL